MAASFAGEDIPFIFILGAFGHLIMAFKVAFAVDSTFISDYDAVEFVI